MLVTVIQVTDYLNAKQQIHFAEKDTNCIELRLDYLEKIDIDLIKKLRFEFNLPMIFTLRKKSQGGFYLKTEKERLETLFLVCALNPDYVDIESDVAPDFVQTIKKKYPTIKIISSYHNFSHTPNDLEHLLKSMQQPEVDIYKISTLANSTKDALRMLHFVKKNNQSHHLIGLCMGEKGQVTRIVGPIIGNVFTYTSVDNNTACNGQLSFHEIISIYHFHQLNLQTKIYALLGDPIQLSIGHVVHNEAIRLLNNNSVYLKLQATLEELPDILHLCRQLSFAGFSITMPLKEAILPLLDEIELSSQPIQAINSIVKSEQAYLGFNTDGIGAMDALAENIDIGQQTILILGAGGAARAIAYEALQRQAHVIILNRTASKAKQLAMELGCEGYDFYSFNKKNYQIMINTLPQSAFLDEALQDMLKNHLLPVQLAMDIVYHPTPTFFLKAAARAKAVCIPGYKMYIRQAILQIQRWFSPNLSQLDELLVAINQFFEANTAPIKQ